MTQTAWAPLSNAKHIDWVLASIKAHPEKWAAARDAVWNAAYDAAYDAAWDAAWDAARKAGRDAARDAAYDAACDAVWYEAWDAAIDAAWNAAWGTIVALIAYDDCAYMIESEVGELKIIAAFGDPRAILLLPACIAFNEIKVLTKASIAV